MIHNTLKNLNNNYMEEFNGTVDIDGIVYPVMVRNGQRYINNMTVDEFCSTLNEDQLIRAARVGKMALDDEKAGIKPPKGKYQYYIND